jgi:hypothetical protein
MAETNIAVFGIYSSRIGAEQGVRALLNSGFKPEDLSILLPDDSGPGKTGIEKGTKAPEGAAAGVGTGAVAGGILGFFAGTGSTLAAAVIAIPGIGPFIAAGPLIAALAGAGIGGTVGAVTGALVGLGIPEYEAKRYEGRVTKGGILLSVHCNNAALVEKAKEVLKLAGAEDISSAQEASVDSGAWNSPEPPVVGLP